jgi:PAS domain S-box-containing protein
MNSLVINQTKNYIKNLFWKAPNPICITKASDGTYLEVNEAFEKLCGLESEDIIGKTSVKIGHMTVEQRIKVLNDIKKRGYAKNIENETKDKNNETIHTLLNTFPIKIGKDGIWLTTITDISELKMGKKSRDDILFRSLAFIEKTGVILIEHKKEPSIFYINEEARRALNGQSIMNLLYVLGENESTYLSNETQCYHVKKISTDHSSPLEIILVERLPDIICIKDQLKQHDLTSRQEEVALLAAVGYSNKEIAEKLFISEYTVNDHLKEIFQKIDIHKRSELCSKILSWR